MLYLQISRCRWPGCRRCYTVCLRCASKQHRYCSEDCQRAAQRHRWRVGSSRYQRTAAGKANHRRRNAKYKRERREKRRLAAAGVTHRPMTVPGSIGAKVESTPIAEPSPARAGDVEEQHDVEGTSEQETVSESSAAVAATVCNPRTVGNTQAPGGEGGRQACCAFCGRTGELLRPDG